MRARLVTAPGEHSWSSARADRTGRSDGDLDLTGELTTLFCRYYENLINRRLVDNIDVDPRSARIPAEPPLSVGSHKSKMIERIRSGACPVQLSQPEVIRLVTWIDANAPYYGVYEGKQNLRWKDAPDFRPAPGQWTAKP